MFEVNAPRPIVLTLFPMFSEVRLTQAKKASSWMLTTEFGITIERRPVASNARSPMVVTELGIITDTRLVHPLKAFCPMAVTEPTFGGTVSEVSCGQEQTPRSVS